MHGLVKDITGTKPSKPYNYATIFRHFILSDLHIGNVACHKRKIERQVKEIVNYPGPKDVVLLGDILDAVAVADKRFALSAMDPDCAIVEIKDGEGTMARRLSDQIINNQIKLAIKLLEPLKGMVTLMLIGNHEEDILRKASGDPLVPIAEALEAPYRSAYCGAVYYQHRRSSGKVAWSYGAFYSHGAGGGRKPGAKVNRVDDRASWLKNARIVASGHNHARSLHDHTALNTFIGGRRRNEFKVDDDVQVCLNTGCTLLGYYTDVTGSLYSERADYPPTCAGNVYVDAHFITQAPPDHSHNSWRATELRGGMM